MSIYVTSGLLLSWIPKAAGIPHIFTMVCASRIIGNSRLATSQFTEIMNQHQRCQNTEFLRPTSYDHIPL